MSARVRRWLSSSDTVSAKPQFSGDSAVIGRRLRLGATQNIVIGIMPEGFAFPINNKIWTPQAQPADYGRGKAPAIEE
jgi:hypothetical protein